MTSDEKRSYLIGTGWKKLDASGKERWLEPTVLRISPRLVSLPAAFRMQKAKEHSLVYETRF